jgi:hypothetical protein
MHGQLSALLYIPLQHLSSTSHLSHSLSFNQQICTFPRSSPSRRLPSSLAQSVLKLLSQKAKESHLPTMELPSMELPSMILPVTGLQLISLSSMDLQRPPRSQRTSPSNPHTSQLPRSLRTNLTRANLRDGSRTTSPSRSKAARSPRTDTVAPATAQLPA